MTNNHYDWIIIGSGFGGSVSALRLTEKGYKVLVIEKGKRFAPGDFPKTNWDLKRWMWAPRAGMRGIFQMSFLPHITILHGVGVGGGSLVYANTLPTPKDEFFTQASWGELADWKKELRPHYKTAKYMLGATPNPLKTRGDRVLEEIARDIGRAEHLHPTEVAVYFGKPGVRTADPFFGGQGPDRVGCTFCGACMTGCRIGAKNTLDKNYLYLAEKGGLQIQAGTEVMAVRERPGKDKGYVIETERSFGPRISQTYTADKVVLSGGVMGTIPLLLKMKEERNGLPRLSNALGRWVRTNNESLIGVLAPGKSNNFAKGVAITSILHTDEHSHLEPVRYGPGSNFFRTMMMPHSPGETLPERLFSAAKAFLKQPRRWFQTAFVDDFATRGQILLYMRTLDETLTMELGRGPHTGFRRGLTTVLDDPSKAPKAFMKEATDLANRFAEKVGGVTASLATEAVLGVPSTAHILGGAKMGSDPDGGVIDSSHQVFGYEGLYVIDGASVSANPGVNPSLTITALAERAMSKIKQKPGTKKQRAVGPR